MLRSDSTAALAVVDKLRSKSPAMNRVARELAIDLTFSATGLVFRSPHVRGVVNEWSDALSRLAQPGSGARVPGPLRAVPETRLPERGAAWWLVEGRPDETAQGLGEGVAE